MSLATSGAQWNSRACGSEGHSDQVEEGTIPWPNPRFEVGSGTALGTVKDLFTGLTWMQTPPTTNLAWADALAYANDLTLGGYDDWRLPSRRELRSLILYGSTNMPVDRSTMGWLADRGLDVPGAAIWSSTSYARDADLAWTVWFGDMAGVDDPMTFDKSAPYHVWPVRGP